MNLSIIIVSYNTKELLRKCLESVIGDQWLVVSGTNEKTPNHQLASLRGRSGSPATEIIVVDNGSTDGSVEMVTELIKNYSRSFVSGTGRPSSKKEVHVPPIRDNSCKLPIRLIENQINVGFAKAVNQGIKSSQGKVILLLNSDTQVKNGALKKLLEFEEKVGPGIIGLKMLNPGGSIQGSVFNLPTIRRAIEEFWLGKKGSFSKFAPTTDAPIEVEAVSGGAMVISGQIIQKIGLFDERYFMYFEDLDFCRRARKAGFKVWYQPEAEIIHEHGASGRDLSDGQNQWRRLIPSSKIYHGRLKYYLINLIIWVGQKF